MQISAATVFNEQGKSQDNWGATQSDVTAGIVLLLVLVLFPLYSLSFSPPIPDERERERIKGTLKKAFSTANEHE
jgi:hypothetical protein